MLTVVVVAGALGLVLFTVLALSRNRRSVRPEEDFYRRAPGQPSPFAGLDLAQFERLCLQLVEAMGLRVKSHARSGPREIEIAASDPHPVTGSTYMIQGVKADAEELVDASRVLALASAVKGEQAAKGILITTGFFAEDAAQPPEGPPIELINQVRLVELVRKYALPL